MNLYIVTGTTKGLGAALRDALSADANNVVICLSRAPHQDDPPINLHVDLANVASIRPALADCERAIAGKSFEQAVLLNNAGVLGPVGPFLDIDARALNNNVQVNLIAPMVLTGLFATMTRRIAKKRLVVNISSGAAKRAMPGWSAYCASKAALEMATRVAAAEADEDLSICSLAPGVVDTPMQEQLRGTSVREFPDVERFRAMKADGVLRPAQSVAHDIIELIKTGKLTNGGNFDIREM